MRMRYIQFIVKKATRQIQFFKNNCSLSLWTSVISFLLIVRKLLDLKKTNFFHFNYGRLEQNACTIEIVHGSCTQLP